MNRNRIVSLCLLVLVAVLGLGLLREVTSRDSAQAPVRNVILVRHAEKAAEPQEDPGLTAVGVERAEALSRALAGMNVGHVITSQYERTIATASAVIRDSGASREEIPAGLGEEALRSVADAVAARPDGETVLIVGHSNTVPSIVAALGGTRYPDLEDHEYDSIFLLQIDSHGAVRTMRLRFGEPAG